MKLESRHRCIANMHAVSAKNGLTFVSAASGIVKLVLSQHIVKASSYLLTYATE